MFLMRKSALCLGGRTLVFLLSNVRKYLHSFMTDQLNIFVDDFGIYIYIYKYEAI